MEIDPEDPAQRNPLQSALERHVHNRSMIAQLSMHTGGNLKDFESRHLPDVFAYYREISDILKKQNQSRGKPQGVFGG